MYKTLEDFLKRVPATSATGDYLRIVEGKVNENFKIAIAPNINFKSSLLDKESIDNIIEFVGAETTKEKDEIKNLLKPYSNVNRTDAQAWITLDRFKEIQIGLGEWNEDLDKAFDRIKDGKKKASAKDYALFSEKMTTMQPKKGVHFELVTDSKNNKIPVYLKYSQAILFPEFISSSYQLTRIAEQMEAQGVSELIVGDGVKVGAIEPTDLGSNRTDLIKFNTITLSNKNWKLQQDLPSKGNKDTLVGSQIKKNVIANINPTSDYNGISGEDLIKAIHTMDGELSNRGLKKVLKKLNVKDGKVDNDALYEMLISEFKDDGESANLLDALKNRVPIDNILSHRQVIWNKISALWNKSTVKIKQPGGAAIQLSDYGFESGEDMVKFENIKNKDKNGIIWLTNDRKLKPPRIVKDAEGNVTMSAGQCLLPYNTIAKSFGKEWDTVKNLPMNELIKKIDKNALKMVGYRIPNQEIASNDSLEIVGILPPHAGDTIVLYSEITTKTGSDFDIDKMYYILPPLKLVNGRVEAVKYLDESNSTIEERYSEYKKELIKRKDIVEELAKEGLNLREVRKLLREFGRKGVSLKMREANLSILLTDEEVDSIIDDILLGSESMMTIEDFGKLSIDEQNTEEALQSRRIDLYRKVLESKHTYKRLITSVDAEWLKDQIRVMLPKQDLSDMELFDGYYQMGIRREFITSKGGVGQVANHQGDNAISQWQEAYLVDSSGRLDIGNLTSEGNLDLSKATSKNFEVLNIKGDKFEIVDNLQDEQYISSSISAYMNAFVDAAKDNYIGAANFNFLTNNPAFLLIRNGVSPQYVNAFMAQPVIRRYVELINKTEGQAVERNTKKPIDLIHEELGLTKEEINDLEEVKLSNYSTSQLMNIVIDDSNNKPIDNKDQAKLLNLFLHVQDLSKTLRDSGMASKADTEAGGKSIGEAYIKRNLKINVSNIHNGNQLTVGNWDEKFNKDGIKTMLGSYHDNSIESIISHVGPLSLLGTNNMQYLLNHSFIELTGEYPKDGDRYNKIYQLSYAALLSELDVFNKGISNKNNDGIQDIMTGDNSVSNRVYKLKSNPLYDNNTLIDMLLTKEGRFGSMDYVYLDNSKSRDKNVNEQITEDWLELYESDNPEDVKLAKDLVLYAYHTSALTDNISSIYRLMPYQIPLDLGLSINSFNQLKYKLNDESTKLNTFTKVFEQVMLNSWDDTSIVPKVSKKNTLKVGDFTSEVDKTIVFAVNEISSPTLKIGNDEKGNLIFKPYVSRDEYIMNPITFNTTKHTRLYKYIGNTEQGDIQAGVYKRVSKLGDRNGRHKLFEFTLGEAKESIVKGNNYKMDKNSISKLNSIVIERPNTIFNTQENITESLPESEIISTIAELDIPSMSEMEEILKELDNGCKTKGKK